MLKLLPEKILENRDEEINPKELDMFNKEFERHSPFPRRQLKTILNAVNHLRIDGEIRLAGHGMDNGEMAFLKIKLKEQAPHIRALKMDAGVVVLKDMGEKVNRISDHEPRKKALNKL